MQTADTARIAPGGRLEIQLDRLPSPEEGELAVFIGEADLTGLLVHAGNRLALDLSGLPLPTGQTEITAYLVSPGGDWTHITSIPLLIETRDSTAPAADTSQTTVLAAGTTSRAPEDSPPDSLGPASSPPDSAGQPARPSDTVGQPSQQQAPSDTSQQPPTDVATRQDVGSFLPTGSVSVNFNARSSDVRLDPPDSTDRVTSGSGTLQSTIQHSVARGRFSTQSRFDLAGASRTQEALRFGEQGDEAPQLDLSSYEIQLQRAPAAFQLGHFSFGTNRHLISAFASRGLTLRVPVRQRLDFAVAAMNGTNIVGFGNFLGLDRSAHRILSGVAGLELVPRKPGMLRVELAGLSGSLLPQSSVNEGSITDAEESRGYGLRLLAGGPNERFQVEAGLTTSTFDNPVDPLLDPDDPLLGADTSVVPVRETTDHARFLEAQFDLLRNLKVTATNSANLRAAYRHERVDPLFRSVAASTQANVLQNQFELTGSVGEITIGAAHTRSRDNLDEIPTLLTTLTRRTALSAGVPLPSVIGGRERPATWLPVLAYGVDRTHQFAESVPEGGGFQDPSFIPDQVSTSHNLTASWQVGRFRTGYALNVSLQDNRQPGRENADLKNTVNGLSLGVTPRQGLDFTIELSLERAKSEETGITDRTRRVGGVVSWQITGASAVTTNLSITSSDNSENTSSRNNAEFDAQWSHTFKLGRVLAKDVQGQFVIRLARQSERSEDTTFGLNDRIRRWTANTGWSITLP